MTSYTNSGITIYNDEKENQKEENKVSIPDQIRTIYIKEFDMSSMPPHSIDDKHAIKICCVGRPGSGKSTLINSIMIEKSWIPVAQIFSGTEDSNHFFSERFPGVCIYNKLDMNAIENFVTRQKIAMKYLPNPWAFQILDDVADNPAILRKPIFQAYYKLGRHWKMVHILSLQYSMDVMPQIRNCIDYTFIFKENALRFRKSLYENYASCIDSFEDFCTIMDTVCQDYACLVINNRSQSNRLEDCVFWYKANREKIPQNYKFCHPSAWAFNASRYDENYSETFDMV
jgi:hypothetical protein